MEENVYIDYAKPCDSDDDIMAGSLFLQVANAMDVGAKGIVLYSDPEDVAPAGEQTYPDGIYLPDTGVQRGSTFKDSMDPLTPGYPATGRSFTNTTWHI